MPSSVKKELTIQEWISEINSGLEYRRQYGVEEAWARLEALYFNVHGSQYNAGPNIIMSNADAMLSSLFVPDPYITVKARRADMIESSRVQETVDNTLLRDLDIPLEMSYATINAFLFSQGILKVGYDSEWGWDPHFDLGGKQQKLGMTLTQFSKWGDRIEFDSAVQSGMPWVQSVNPHDFIVPWGSRDIDGSPWCAHRVIRHIDEIKADPKYDSKGLQPNMSMVDFVKSHEAVVKTYRFGQAFHQALSGVTGASNQNMEYCELWEIHDRRTGKIIVVTHGYEKFLRNEIDYLQLEGGLPFVSMSFIPRTRNFWTTPDAYYLEQVQNELNDIAIQGTKHRRARVLKFIAAKGSFTNDEMENLLSPEVGVMAMANTMDDPNLQNKVIPLNVQADMGLIQEAQWTQNNARQMIGLSANQTGEYNPSGRRSATEAQIVQNSSTLRMDRRSQTIARTYSRLFEIINPICWKFWTTPRMTQIITQDGQQVWKQFIGEHLRGDYAYNVGFSTGGSESLAQRRQNALQLFAMLQNNPMIDPTGLVRQLNYAFNDPEFSQIFKAGALSGQLQNQMQQVQLMQQLGGAQGGTMQGNQNSSGANPIGLLQGATQT